MATSIFRDPFYYGVLIQAGNAVDLRELNPNFKPMITENEYNAVQEISRSKTRKNVVKYKQKGHIFLPFRQFLEEIYKALNELHFDEKDYKRCLELLKNYTDVKLDKLIVEKRSLQGVKNRKKTKLNEYADTYAKFDDKTPEIVKQKTREQFEMLQEDVINVEKEIAKVESQIINPEGLKMNQENFLNSLNLIEKQMRARNPVGKDLLAREILLNWEIDQQNRVFYRYKDPIELAHKYIKSTFGAPD